MLTAHHRTQAAASGKAVLVNSDAGNRNQTFAGRANRCNAQFVVTGFLHNGIDRLNRVLAPYGDGVFDLNVIVYDLEVNRFGRLAFQDKHVIAGIFKGWAPVGTGGRVCIGPGLRRNPHNTEFGSARNRRPLKRTGCKDNQILR